MTHQQSNQCPICGQPMDAGASVCDACGCNMTVFCLGCGAPTQPQYNFCPACGRPLGSNELAPTYQELQAAYEQYREQLIKYARDLTRLYMLHSQLEKYFPTGLVEKVILSGGDVVSEHRYVTVLFADLVEFVTLSASMAAEEVFVMMNSYFRILVEQIYKFGGSVDKFMGDGIMVLFGVPTPHEDDPERAVRAALGMLQAIDGFSQAMLPELGKPLRLRIGITSGDLVAGTIGVEGRQSYTVMGKTVNIANRLQAAAEPGMILVNEDVYRQTRHLFDYRVLPPLAVKGIDEAMPVFEVVGLAGAKQGEQV